MVLPAPAVMTWSSRVAQVPSASLPVVLTFVPPKPRPIVPAEPFWR